ncbi:MAG: hypothetical protein ACO1OQ_03725 [Rufibacter sp.]
MKRIKHVAAAAVVAFALGFASCESKTAQNVENTAESAADEISAGVDSLSLDSIEVRDTPVNDGVADKIEE